ncbi:FliO: flagellar biosynthetic protein [Desulfosarcina variabilis str. Montpellier]|uniref:flagellar biosynthetic protein FliO n=1 Tax=Desulfosarcina variabilis TaxID=2300 RepID=UPI003AFAA37F
MNAAPDMITTGLKMIAALGMVLAMILVLLYGLRKMASQRIGVTGGKRIQVLENHYMGVKKSIALVQVPGKVLVVGLSADRINLLDTLDETMIETPSTDKSANAFGPLLSNRLKSIGRKRKGKDAS